MMLRHTHMSLNKFLPSEHLLCRRLVAFTECSKYDSQDGSWSKLASSLSGSSRFSTAIFQEPGAISVKVNLSSYKANRSDDNWLTKCQGKLFVLHTCSVWQHNWAATALCRRLFSGLSCLQAVGPWEHLVWWKCAGVCGDELWRSKNILRITDQLAQNATCGQRQLV